MKTIIDSTEVSELYTETIELLLLLYHHYIIVIIIITVFLKLHTYSTMHCII